MKKHFLIVALALLLFLDWAMAHGGGSGHSSVQSQSTPKEFKRLNISATPSVLARAELKVFGSGVAKIPEDIVIVSCKLNKMARCRGIKVVLQDRRGEEIVKTNSGFDGILGFQGLKPDRKYLVKILSEKYEGSTYVETAKHWVLDGHLKGSSDIFSGR